MTRSIKTPSKPTKFEDLDPRTQEFLKERGLKKSKATAGPPSKQIDGIQTIVVGKDQIFDVKYKDKMEKKAKGGRAGFRMGGKCKLAIKGKGRAYGKNS